ncbi:MAG: GNAT family N-acetyltransferase [Chitinophagaceae bacterium]
MTVITRMSADQQAVILDIYRQGIASGMATFETEVPSWEEFESKYLPHSRIMVLEDGVLAGWAALSPVSTRDCYRGVAEVSVYVADSHQRKGIGRMLLQGLIKESEQNGIWSLLSVIHEENKASIHLHEQCGFRYIGYREKIARLNGVWLTTVMMERRSVMVGV